MNRIPHGIHPKPARLDAPGTQAARSASPTTSAGIVPRGIRPTSIGPRLSADRAKACMLLGLPAAA